MSQKELAAELDVDPGTLAGGRGANGSQQANYSNE
jgi:hypothetical protein